MFNVHKSLLKWTRHKNLNKIWTSDPQNPTECICCKALPEKLMGHSQMIGSHFSWSVDESDSLSVRSTLRRSSFWPDHIFRCTFHWGPFVPVLADPLGDSLPPLIRSESTNQWPFTPVTTSCVLLCQRLCCWESNLKLCSARWVFFFSLLWQSNTL